MHSKSLLAASRLVLQFVLCLAAALVPTPAGAQKSTDAASSKWALVQVEQELRVIPSAEVGPLKKRLETEWKQAVKDFDEQRKAASKDNTEFTASKPARPRFKVIKNGFKSEEAAEAARAAQLADAAPKAKSSSESSYVVVKVGKDHRVVEAATVKSLKAEIAAADKQAAKDYEAAKKAAKKANEPFDREKPGKTVVQVVQKFSSEEEAKAHLEKVRSGNDGSR